MHYFWRTSLPLALFGIVVLQGCQRERDSDLPIVASFSESPANEILVTHEGISMEVHVKPLEGAAWEQNKVLVLLPSASFSVRPCWDLPFGDYSVMDYFAERGWTVVAIDLPGFGRSDPPSDPASFGAARAIDYLDAVIDQLSMEHGFESVDLLGWSWGGQVAGLYAQEHPERVRRLLLCGFTHHELLSEDVLYPGAFRELNFDDSLRDFTPDCFEKEIDVNFGVAVIEWGNQAMNGPMRDFVYELPLVDPTRLSMPVAVICGQYELYQHPSVPGYWASEYASRRQELNEFCAALPDGRELIMIESGGHIVHLEKPYSKWRETIIEFLDD